MIWALALAVFATVAAGVYLALSRDLLRCVIGVSLIGAAANLVVFIAGRVGTMVPPVIPEGSAVLDAAVNPLPQALVLTAIVIGFALTCFSLVLVLALKSSTGVNDSEQLRLAEVPPGDDGKPAIEDPALDHPAQEQR
jgi:multicomponent Na+:H+ antiporter subunit C